MDQPFWFNRMVEYWGIPLQVDLVDLVRRARLQVVQAGTFGPQFYSLADDEAADRRWVGMPHVGIEENLAHVQKLIPAIQDAGARFIGQMSMTWHYGDHENGKGLFGVWDKLWTDDLLGAAPCSDPMLAQEKLTDGTVRCWPIEGRPYRAYCGCLSNPNWIAILKPMIRKAIELGVDGLMVHHNFSNFCACAYCQVEGRKRFGQTFEEKDLRMLFGTHNLKEVEDVFTPRPDCPENLKKRVEAAVLEWEHHRRKEVFDELYITYGRSLKPDLMLSQWYHKYDFKPRDERSLLPTDRWAKDEDYIWYSQGGHKGMSLIKHGYLTDMGLPARFIYAAGEGRPFVINKYDYKRFRLAIAEAGANHAAAPAFHWEPQEDETYILEEYTAPLIRYHRFLSEHEDLIHPATPWSQIVMVYPRRAEVAGEGDALDILKRIGRLLEDRHLLFEIILDEQVMERINDFEMVILPGIRRMSQDEAACIRQFVTDGGKLLLAGETPSLQPDGQPYEQRLFSEWHNLPQGQAWGTIQSEGEGQVLHIPEAPWKPNQVEVRPDVTLRLYPLHDEDPFGQAFVSHLDSLLDTNWLRTDAPWYIRMRAWRPTNRDALVLHWINYRQDEESAIEVPIPAGPIQVDCGTPSGYEVDRVEWHYPEMQEPVILPHDENGSRIKFTIPGVIVYGLSVLVHRQK